MGKVTTKQLHREIALLKELGQAEINAIRRATDEAKLSYEKRVTEAKAAYDSDKANSNEFRDTLKDQAARFPTREEVQELRDRIANLATRSEVQVVKERSDKGITRGEALATGIAFIMALLGLAAYLK